MKVSRGNKREQSFPLGLIGKSGFGREDLIVILTNELSDVRGREFAVAARALKAA
jgi:hypothetical protein